MDNARRFRGLVGISALWGAGVAIAATATLAVGLATGLVPSSIFGARELIAVALRGFAVGAMGGGVFASILARRARGETVSTLSTARVATWGFVAGAALPTLVALVSAGPVLPFGIIAAASVVAGAGGSVLGAGLLRVARRAPVAAAIDSGTTDERLLNEKP